MIDSFFPHEPMNIFQCLSSATQEKVQNPTLCHLQYDVTQKQLFTSVSLKAAEQLFQTIYAKLFRRNNFFSWYPCTSILYTQVYLERMLLLLTSLFSKSLLLFKSLCLQVSA